MWTLFAQDMKYAMEGESVILLKEWANLNDCLICKGDLRYSPTLRRQFIRNLTRTSCYPQSTRSTDCARAPTTWTCTSRSSGSTTNTSRSCRTLRTSFPTTRRKCMWRIPSQRLNNLLFDLLADNLFFLFFPLQMVPAVCAAVVGGKWGRVYWVYARSPGEGQKRWSKKMRIWLLYVVPSAKKVTFSWK